MKYTIEVLKWGYKNRFMYIVVIMLNIIASVVSLRNNILLSASDLMIAFLFFVLLSSDKIIESERELIDELMNIVKEQSNILKEIVNKKVEV